MAPRPHVFVSREEIIASMRDQAIQKDIDNFSSLHNCSIQELVASSVSGNTFRAFPLPKELGLRPSSCYRHWTTIWIVKIVDLVQSRYSTLSNNTLRLELIAGAHGLDSYWREVSKGLSSMGFGRAAKLLGLSVKHLLWHRDLSLPQRKALALSLDVPLDSYTLQGIRKALPELNVPIGASMGFVKTEEQYKRIQDAIRAMCMPDLTPLHYETLAWRMSHPEIK